MDPLLYKVATQGNVTRLKQLVLTDPTVLSATTPQLNSELHLAALHGHVDFAVEVLERNEALLVAQNDDGDTPLHLATKSGKQEVAKLLVDRALTLPPDQKSPLLMTNNAGNSPLHEAVRTGLVNVVHKILDSWFHTEYFPPASVSGTALHQAVLCGHIGIVKIMLDKWPGWIYLTDSDGNNALHYAEQKNHPSAVEMLLSKQSELAYKRNLKTLWSPLHVAAHYGSTDAIKALLRHCPDVAEMVDSSGRNAFHLAVVSNSVSSLKCLLRHVGSAKVLNRVDHEGNTPLHLAVKLGLPQECQLLLRDSRVDPCVRNLEGQTARSLIESQDQMLSHTIYVWGELKKLEYSKCKGMQLPPPRMPAWWNEFSRYVENRMVTYILVATLIATVTFSATFTMPGGYDQQEGTAIFGPHTAFKVFVVANTLAMLSSIVVVFSFIWARGMVEDFKARQVAWTHRLTVVACLAMVASLTTAVYLTVEPKSPWLAYFVIAMGSSTPVVMSVLACM